MKDYRWIDRDKDEGCLQDCDPDDGVAFLQQGSAWISAKQAKQIRKWLKRRLAEAREDK